MNEERQTGHAYRQTGIAQVIIIIIVLLGLVAGVYLVQQQTNFFPKAASPKKVENMKKNVPGDEAKKGQEIKNKSELGDTLKDLDTTDIDGLGKELSENDIDAASF